MTNPLKPSRMDAHMRLLRMATALGPQFGTEDLSLLLYALVRMQKPETIVELGTGLGISALWMAHAADCNGTGHVYTVDDLDLLRGDEQHLPTLLSLLARAGVAELEASTPAGYFDAIARTVGVEERLTVIERRMDLAEPDHFANYPFADRSIDLLFSDFLHGPDHVLWLLAHFLPLMAPSSSILIDSVGSEIASYLATEQIVAWLDSGRVPAALSSRWDRQTTDLMRLRRFRVMHLTEAKNRAQNTTTWLQIEPAELWPPGASRQDCPHSPVSFP